MNKKRQSLWRLLGGMGALAVLLGGGLLATESCGFGTYDDSAAPQVVSANDGVWDAGQWWPWACALDGGALDSGTVIILTNPSPESTPINYTASGTCGAGGVFALSVDGCEMFGNFDALGLDDVTTNIPSSIPQAGGWEVAGNVGDAGWICDAIATDAAGDLTFTCSDGDAGCESTLKIASGS